MTVLVWFSGRNTPVVASSVAAAKKSGAAGSKGKVVASRKPTAEEQKQISKGNWIRARKPGSSQTSKSGSFKYRPALKKKAKGRKVK